MLEPYIKQVDMVLVMTVEPGFGGQKYIGTSTEKIRETRRLLEQYGLQTDVQVDGGITAENVAAVKEAGANVIVAGSAIFGGNITDNVKGYLAQF